MAIGSGADANSSQSLAIGYDSDVNSSSNYGVAVGYMAKVTGQRGMVFGWDSVATQTGALSLGYDTKAQSQYSSAIGAEARTSSGSNAMSLGKSYASGSDSLAAAIANNTNTYGAQGSSSIALGFRAKATSSNSIAIGAETVSSGFDNSICIGWQSNATSGRSAAVLGGRGNNSSANYSTVVGGQTNTASSAYASSIGGSNNTSSGVQSTAIGGEVNTAAGEASYAYGKRAKATEIGKYAYGHQLSGTVGATQGGMMILAAATTDATATVLRSNNNAATALNQIVAASDTAITFDGTITAMQNGAQAYASWRIEGLLVNDGGTTTLANSATTVISNGSSWGMALSADNTNNALAVTVTGEASHNIRWVANIRTSEVTYA